MNFRRSIGLFLASALLCSLTACFNPASGSSGTVSSPLPQENTGASPNDITASSMLAEDNGSLVLSSTISVEDLSFTDRELDGSFDTASATVITLSDNASTVSGRGAVVSGNTVTISAAGTYLVSGTLSSGQIVINATGSDKIQLVLQGANIHCTDSAAIYVMQADKVFLTLAAGTENTISCGEVFSDAANAAEITAAIFSKDDLAINGSGSLSVTGGSRHGIVSKDDLSIADAAISVNAASDGIRGKDCVRIASGTFDITAGSDGIQSNNDADAALGYVYIAGGTCSITAANDGIQAETLLCIADGTFFIQTGGGSANASSHLSSSWEDFFRGDRHDRNFDQTSVAVDTAASDSFKGLKAGTSLVIAGGTISVDAADDAVHCDGDIAIREGCTLSLSSGDDGIHAEKLLSVTGGTITVSKSYEGLESTLLQILGGNLSVIASDDGLNASDGSSGGFGGFGGMMGGFGNKTASGNTPALLISGGGLYVNANGDGLDSNGPLNVTGGEIFVDGPTNSGNGAIDCGDGCEAFISGGTLWAAGASGMAESFGHSSTQCSMLVSFGGSISGGTEITVQDSAGCVILRYTPAKAYQCVVISSPLIKEGESYTVVAGSSSVQITITSVSSSNGSGSGFQGGTGGHGGFGGDRGSMTKPGKFDQENADRTPPSLPQSSGGQRPGTIPEMPEGGRM